MNRHFTYDSKYFPPAPVVTIKLTVKETNLSAADLTALIDTGADASFDQYQPQGLRFAAASQGPID